MRRFYGGVTFYFDIRLVSSLDGKFINLSKKCFYVPIKISGDIRLCKKMCLVLCLRSDSDRDRKEDSKIKIVHSF